MGSSAAPAPKAGYRLGKRSCTISRPLGRFRSLRPRRLVPGQQAGPGRTQAHQVLSARQSVPAHIALIAALDLQLTDSVIPASNDRDSLRATTAAPRRVLASRAAAGTSPALTPPPRAFT